MSDGQIEELYHKMNFRCEEFCGNPVLFELLDLSREYLTESNVPKAAPCSICLNTFQEEDTFCKTKCYHHFHSFCLGEYLKSLIDEFTQHLGENQVSIGQDNAYNLGNIQRSAISQYNISKPSTKTTLLSRLHRIWLGGWGVSISIESLISII